ncbi:MAG: hypothetical protein KatS3mg107_0103 [Gemmataceae bacterium]|jgi:hypothetical protein|nr:MAG: hypothetical protein KatS3mg107_0103 [Gemmataceae bacterium]
MRRGEKPVGPSHPWTGRPVRACLFWHPASGRHRRQWGATRGEAEEALSASGVILTPLPSPPCAEITGPVPPSALCFHSSAAHLPHSLAMPEPLRLNQPCWWTILRHPVPYPSSVRRNLTSDISPKSRQWAIRHHAGNTMGTCRGDMVPTKRAWPGIMGTSSIRNNEACGEKNTVCGEDVNREKAGERLSIPSVPRFYDFSKLERRISDNVLAFHCHSTVTSVRK